MITSPPVTGATYSVVITVGDDVVRDVIQSFPSASPSHVPHRKPHHTARLRHRRQRNLGPASGYLYDSANGVYPPGAQNVAGYANGPYATSRRYLRSHHKHVLMIDTSGTAPASAGALDVEPGDATPAQAGPWAASRIRKTHSSARLYFPPMYSSAVHQSVSQEPGYVRARVKYWEANPTGTPHQVPGSSATQYAWGSSGRWDSNKFSNHFMGG